MDEPDTKPESKLEDDELIERVKKHYKLAADHTKQWRTDAREDYGFVDGSGQWDESDSQVLRDQLRPPVTFNRVGPVIDAVTGQEIVNRQEVTFFPREQGDVKSSEMLSGAAEWARDQCDAEDEESDAFFDSVVCGMGWTETFMDYEIDLDGMICIERMDPLEMGWDTTARKRNLSDARWVWRVKEYSKAEFESKWPDKVDEVDHEDSDWNADIDRDSPHHTVAGDQYAATDSHAESKAENTVKVIQYQWYERVKVWRVADPMSGELSTLSEAEYNKVKSAAEEMPEADEFGQVDPNHFAIMQSLSRAVEQREKKYFRCLVAGGAMLERGDCPYPKGFTYKAITAKRDRNTNTWYGLVRSMKDPQRWANKWLSQIMHIINSNAKGGLMAEQSAFVDPRKAEAEWADPTAITMFKDGALQNGKILPKSPITYPAGLDKLMEYAVTSIRDVAGVNIDMLAQRDGNAQMSGVLDYQRRQQGTVLLGQLFGGLRRYRKESGRVLLHFITEYLSDGRLIRITGEAGKQYVPLVMDEGNNTYDIVVDDAASSPNQREKTFAVLSGMLPGLLQAGIPVPPEIIDYAPLPSGLQEKWKEALTKPKGPSPEEVAMLKQGVQILQAENDKLRNDISLKQEKQQGEQALKADDQQFTQSLEQRELAVKQLLADQAAVFEEAMARNAHELDVWKAEHEIQIKEMVARQRPN